MYDFKLYGATCGKLEPTEKIQEEQNSKEF